MGEKLEALWLVTVPRRRVLRKLFRTREAARKYAAQARRSAMDVTVSRVTWGPEQ